MAQQRKTTLQKVQALQSKAEVFYSVIANAKPDDLVFIGNKALRKSFITSIEPICNPDTKVKGSRIYFSLDFNDYRDRLCSYMDFWEPEVSFEDIKRFYRIKEMAKVCDFVDSATNLCLQWSDVQVSWLDQLNQLSQPMPTTF